MPKQGAVKSDPYRPVGHCFSFSMSLGWVVSVPFQVNNTIGIPILVLSRV